MSRESRLRVTEIFHSLQGESSFAGRRCTFIRLTGCHLRCVWCDTGYSFHGGQWMHLEEILQQVDAAACRLVEITGGEPLLQEPVHPLMRALCDRGYTVMLETSGAVDCADVDPRVIKILDVKCPGSGEEPRNCWSNFDRLNPLDEVKFVVADRQDYEYARQVILERGLSGRGPLPLLSAVHGALPLTSLAAWMLEDRLEARLQVQLHKLIWGAEATGV